MAGDLVNIKRNNARVTAVIRGTLEPSCLCERKQQNEFSKVAKRSFSQFIIQVQCCSVRRGYGCTLHGNPSCC